MFIRTGVNNWLNTDHIAEITWYPEEHEFIVKWTTGLTITVSEEQGVRALEDLIQRTARSATGTGIHLTNPGLDPPTPAGAAPSALGRRR